MRSTVIVAAFAALGLAACGQGSMEEAGENADSQYEETTQGQKDLSDGPLEILGEQVDEAGDNIEQGARDAGNTVEREYNQAKTDAEKAAEEAEK